MFSIYEFFTPKKTEELPSVVKIDAVHLNFPVLFKVNIKIPEKKPISSLLLG